MITKIILTEVIGDVKREFIHIFKDCMLQRVSELPTKANFDLVNTSPTEVVHTLEMIITQTNVVCRRGSELLFDIPKDVVAFNTDSTTMTCRNEIVAKSLLFNDLLMTFKDFTTDRFVRQITSVSKASYNDFVRNATLGEVHTAIYYFTESDFEALVKIVQIVSSRVSARNLPERTIDEPFTYIINSQWHIKILNDKVIHLSNYDLIFLGEIMDIPDKYFLALSVGEPIKYDGNTVFLIGDNVPVTKTPLSFDDAVLISKELCDSQPTRVSND